MTSQRHYRITVRRTPAFAPWIEGAEKPQWEYEGHGIDINRGVAKARLALVLAQDRAANAGQDPEEHRETVEHRLETREVTYGEWVQA